MKIFLDTSGLLSAFDIRAEDHQEAEAFWQRIFASKEWREIVISDYILDEMVTLIRSKINHRTACKVLNIILEFINHKKLQLIWIESRYFYDAKNIFERYIDQDFSFTDCTSFAVCKDLKIRAAFAFDRHFNTFGITKYPQNG